MNRALISRLCAALAAIALAMPSVALESNKIFVAGSVKHTGVYPFNSKQTALEAIRAAGGFATDKSYTIRIMRFRPDKVSLAVENPASTELQDGDLVIVYQFGVKSVPSTGAVRVLGAVNKSVLVKADKPIGATELLERAGGATDSTYYCLIFHAKGDGVVEQRRYRLAELTGVVVEPNSTVLFESKRLRIGPQFGYPVDWQFYGDYIPNNGG